MTMCATSRSSRSVNTADGSGKYAHGVRTWDPPGMYLIKQCMDDNDAYLDSLQGGRPLPLRLWLWTGDSSIWLKRLSELKLGDRLAVYIRQTITKFQGHLTSEPKLRSLRPKPEF